MYHNCPNSDCRAEGKTVCWGQALRLLSLMDTLVSQKACKGAALHLLSGSVLGEEQLADLFPPMLSLLVPPADHSLQQQQCSEVVGTILQSLCDQVRCIVHLKADIFQNLEKLKALHILFYFVFRTFLWWFHRLVKAVCQRLSSWPMLCQGEK